MTIWVEKRIVVKGLNFGKWASFHLRNIALKFLSLRCSLVSRMDVCKKGKQVGKAMCFLHAQYLENKANLSVKTTGHCITYLNKSVCEIWSVFDKVYFQSKY